MSNPLQEALEIKQEEQLASSQKKEKPPKRKKKEPDEKGGKTNRVNTAMIGGHFPRKVQKQLKILAAEEEVTSQELLEEALDLLFVKKGKKKIQDLV